MSEYNIPLDKEKWSKHYNLGDLESVIISVQKGKVQIWAEELCQIINPHESCLEIGCGTGISSLWLARNGRNVTALDYTESSIDLVSVAAKKMGIKINAICCDATKELPFERKQFDVIFQSGLLEHFTSEEQIELLSMWGGYCARMISMIPNAASIPYRIGKQIMEKNGTWEYGREVPRHSLVKEFTSAGYEVEREYTIGTEWALKFLPKRHYIVKFYKKMLNQGINLDGVMQGYLLVTIGRKN